MPKTLFLTGAMLLAVPALSQAAGHPLQAQSLGGVIGDLTPSSQSVPSTPSVPPQARIAPTGDAITAQTTPPAPAPIAPTDPVVASQSAAPIDTGAPAGQTPAQPSANEVAQIIDREFGAYDKDGDGRLDRAEFAIWMVALKTLSDPATVADSPETRKWVGAAFAQADLDRNASLTKAELTGFLSQGQS